MSVETLRSFLLWCSIINAGFLLLWGLATLFLLGRLLPLYTRMLGVSADQFNAINYAGILFYKMGLWMFNIIPCIVLYFIK
jgi:hypothetical protein